VSTTIVIPGTRMVLMDPFDPTNQLFCGSAQSSGLTDTLDGEVRYYAGGLAEPSVRSQDSRSYPITLKHLSSVQVAQVRAWRGTTLIVRSVDGERFFATYFAIAPRRVLRTTPEDGTPEQVTYDVDIEFTRVSFDETLL
jgi:hypothetical protein